MSVIRHYFMTAAPGKGDELQAALAVLLDAVKAIPGSEGVEMARDLANPERFLFIERWSSVEAHKAARAHLTPEVMGPVMGALAGPPDGAYFDPLKTA